MAAKTIEIKVTDAPIHFYVLPHNRGIQLQSYYEGPVDTLFSGNLQQFRRMLIADDKTSQLFGNSIEITGDIKLASKLQRILANTQIDWQGLTANITGDLIAHQLAELVNTGNAQMKRTQQSLGLNITEYLQEEIHMLPSGIEVTGFIQDVDETNRATQRLDARLNAFDTAIKACKANN
jgi:ubiquinone biosynthesis protein UbiJ